MLLNSLVYGQKKVNTNYVRYIDSADYYLDRSPQKAQLFLDSIPEPVEVSIQGYLAEYYQIKVFINDRLNNKAELIQNSLMALKYGKVEKNYDVAGVASIELFFNTYFIKKDSTAFKYLKDAETYFKKSENTNGLAEVQQMYAYVELYKKNYSKSNALILQHLDKYKAIKDDGYYYMYALFMLSSNYIHQDDLYQSHKYYNRLKSLTDTTISKHLYDVHKVTLTTCFAEYHLNKKTMDSALFYLKKSEELRHAMNTSDTELYFKTYADYFGYLNDIEGKAKYIDSLSNFQTTLLEKNINASLKINESLEKTEDLLDSVTDKKRFSKNLIVILTSVLAVLMLLFILGYKKFKSTNRRYINNENESSYLKSNHEKLKAKVHGLEEYISEVKKEIKTISSIDNTSDQKIRIKDLYKNIHHNSSTLLAKGENHLDLINDLNINFFTQIAEKHPQLNHSEIIVCYYIFVGFKNKEIAAFLNTTFRAIESKRYRIRKKLNFQKGEAQLVEYLHENFK
ncbi:hypothetical protein LY08_01224 [Olleya aquimaris]|uniref:HTH luxR-type domain-containing protein n=1 Tax=Olleya aquimaris TaxID=639310 RepID=A0A327RL66_9FLAO|nr:hypothetical protein LY08_01224 [Olleya aquimaris]